MPINGWRDNTSRKGICMDLMFCFVLFCIVDIATQKCRLCDFHRAIFQSGGFYRLNKKEGKKKGKKRGREMGLRG